jgi:hypothetical protein
MKFKHVPKLITFLVLIFNIHCLSACPQPRQVEQPSVSCPAVVVCDGKNCTPQANNCNTTNDTWDFKALSATAAGQYTFENAIAPFHSSTNLTVECHYKNVTTNADIVLKSLPTANLEAFYEKTQSWQWDASAQLAKCADANLLGKPDLCPLKAKSALVIYNRDIMYGVNIVSNISNANLSQVGINAYTSILIEDLISTCGSVKECHLGLKSPKGDEFGEVVVDMQNNMKIISITPANPNIYRLSQVGGNNVVEVGFNR